MGVHGHADARLTGELLRRYERQAVLLDQPRELPDSVRVLLARSGIYRFLGIPEPEMFDAHTNFAYSTVATAPSPASSGTSLVVHAGDGSLFPAVPFNATVWPAATQPLSTNAEIVRVTARSTDTLTITRAQESSSARSILAGDQIAATVTQKTLNDVENALGCKIYRTTTQSISSGAWTAISFDSERFDTDSMHESVTHPTRITFNTAGKWMVAGNYQIAANGTGTRWIAIYPNGSSTALAQFGPNPGTASFDARMNVALIHDFAVNDYIELQVYQDSGGNLNIKPKSGSGGGDFDPWFSAVLLGA